MGRHEQTAQSVEMFDALIREHTRLLKLSTSFNDDQARFEQLLDGFGIAERRSQQLASEQAVENLSLFPVLLAGYNTSRKAWAEAQQATAGDFSIFEVLNIIDDEQRHSRILAWLLDKRIEIGTHAQGSLGFRLFLETLKDKLNLPDSLDAYSQMPYWVRRELCGETSRIDIEIAARRGFILHIENKIGSPEGKDQTDREWEDFVRRANELEVPKGNRKALFLTPTGRDPTNPKFIPVSWDDIVAILKKFADAAKPPAVKLFANHYAQALRRFVVSELESKEGEDATPRV
jgi:hypothetical protein